MATPNVYKFKYNPLSNQFDYVFDNTVLHFKDPVDVHAQLPLSGNTEGDSRFVKDTDKIYVWSIASATGLLTDWKDIGTASGDMSKAVYDTDDDGIVDKAEAIDDGTHTANATDLEDAVTKKHSHTNKAELDKVTDGDHDVRTDNPHSVTKAQVSLTNVPDLDTTSAVANDHTHSNKATLDDVTQSTITKNIILKVFEDDESLVTGDGYLRFVIPIELNNMDLVNVGAHVYTASSSGLPTVAIYNETDSQDMLSTDITIDATEYDSKDATTAPVIDTTHDDVATGDVIRIDVDVAGTGTKGLEIRLGFRA